ncbi:MAG: hypothetical protein ACE5IP_10645 [Terriglobia bacterium]
MRVAHRVEIFLSVGLIVSFFLPGAVLPAAAQRGALVLQQNLVQLVDEAATIIRGHVVSARVEPHPDFRNISTVVVILRVQETLKGEAGSVFRFRQYIWDIRDRTDSAGYRKGQHVLLLLTKPSRYGLSSPVGLEQGRFRIVRDRSRVEHAVNGHANAGLFRNLMPELQERSATLAAGQVKLIEAHRRGAVSLEGLQALIRQIAARK